MANLIIILFRRSLEIIKKDGFKGYIIAIRKYYESYPPLRKNLYYWIYSKLHSSKLVIRTIQGSKMYLNLNDFGLSKHRFISGIREPECTRIMKQELEKGMTIAEIGANIGYYALMEALIIGKKGKIYAIEPFPENFELLQKNIKLNSYDDIAETYNIAISNRSGKDKLYTSSKHNLCNMIESETDNFIEINTETLDNFIADKKLPDLIRMDIEGFEYYVVDGMKKTLEKCKSCKIFIEIHPYQMEEKGLDFKKPIKTFFEYGFKPKYVVKEYGALKEESFEYNKPTKNFLQFLREKEMFPPEYTHGFGLFLEKK